MSDIKTLGISVKADGLTQTVNTLGKLVTVAKDIDKPIGQVKDSLDNLSKVDMSVLSAQLASVQSTVKSWSATTSNLAETAASFKNLSTTFTALATASEKLSQSTAGLAAYSAQLKEIKTSLEGMKGLRLPSSFSSSGSSTSQVSSARSAVVNDTGYTSAQLATIRQLEREADMTGRTKIQYLELKAAKMGVTEATAPFIARIKDSQKGMENYTMSAKQVAFATRMIPAQMTDVVTQLAGGQNPLLIMVQQGGQIKDMFQGQVGPALKAVGGYILALVNPWTLAAGAIAAFGYAAYKSAEATKELNNALNTTNNYADITTSKFNTLASSISGGKVSLSQAQESITGLASSGRFTNEEISKLAPTIAKAAAAGGKSIETLIQDFVSLKDAPLSSIQNLNKSMNFLDASTQEAIRTLVEQGNTIKATEVAVNAYAAAQDNVSKKSMQQMPEMISSWERLKNAIKNAFTATPKDPTDDALQKLQTRLRAAEQESGKNSPRTQQAREELADFQQKLSYQRMMNGAQAEYVQAQKAVSGYVDVLARDQDSIASKEDKRNKELDKIKNTYSNMWVNAAKLGVVTEAQKAAYLEQNHLLSEQEMIQRAMEKYKDKGVDSAQNKAASLKETLVALKSERDSLESQGAAYEKVTDYGKQLGIVKDKLATKQYGGESEQSLRVQLSYLTEIVKVEKQRDDLKAGNAQEKKWQKESEDAKSLLESLKQQNKELVDTDAKTNKITASEKKLEEARRAAADPKSTPKVKEAAQKAVQDLTPVVTQEKANEAQKSLNSASQEYNTRLATQKQSLADLNEEYSKQLEWLTMTTDEKARDKANWEIEKKSRQEIAKLTAEQNQLEKQGYSDAAGKKGEEIEQLKKYTEQQKIQLKLSEQNQYAGADTWEQIKTGARGAWQDMTKQNTDWQGVFTSTWTGFTDLVGTACTTGKADFRSFTASVLSDIAKMLAKMAMLKAMEAASSSYSSGSGIFSLFGGGTSAAASSSGAVSSVNAGAESYGDYIIAASAKGNAFTGATRFANGGAFTNGVYSSPTPFAFASGGTFNQGVMGEAGPEAVMPLARDSSGKLGIKSSGSSSSNNNFGININIANGGSTSEVDSSKTSTDDYKQMGLMLSQKVKQLIIEEQRPGGVLAKVR